MTIKRGVLDAETLSDAIGAISSTRRSSSHNYLLGYSQGEAFDIEAAPNELSSLMPEESVLTQTNHFMLGKTNIPDLKIGGSPDSLLRRHRLSKLLKNERGGILPLIL